MPKNERIEENNFRMRCDSRILLTTRKHAWHKADGVRIGPFGVKVTLASFPPLGKSVEGSSSALRRTLLLASCVLTPLALGQDAAPPAVPPNTGGVVANGLQSVIN